MSRKCSKSVEFILVALITLVMMLSYGVYKMYYEKHQQPEAASCRP
jgi:hypothetical protein